jgi:glutathione S-transferase
MVKPMMGGGTPDEDKIAAGLADFQRFGRVLDDHLQGREWLVGDTITLADLSVATELTYAGPAQIDLQPFANIRRWYGAIEARDAWKKSAPAMP